MERRNFLALPCSTFVKRLSLSFQSRETTDRLHFIYFCLCQVSPGNRCANGADNEGCTVHNKINWSSIKRISGPAWATVEHQTP